MGNIHDEMVARIISVGRDLIENAEVIAPPDESLLINLDINLKIISDGQLFPAPVISVNTECGSKNYRSRAIDRKVYDKVSNYKVGDIVTVTILDRWGLKGATTQIKGTISEINHVAIKIYTGHSNTETILRYEIVDIERS